MTTFRIDRLRRIGFRVGLITTLAAGLLLAPLAATPASATNTSTQNLGPGIGYGSTYAAGNSMSWTMTVERNPGPEAAVFWANQFGFTNGGPTNPAGYLGLQTSPTGGSWRVSIWGADNCVASTVPNSSCGTSVEGTPFTFLRIDAPYTVGTAYTFTMTKTTGDWWVYTVVNHSSNTIMPMGSIHVPTNGQLNQTNPGGQFTEYFQPGDNKVLEGVATDAALVSAPIVDGVQTTIPSLPVDPLHLNGATIVDGGTAVQTNYLPGNSAREPITLAGDASIGLLGGTPDTLTKIDLPDASADGNEESWVFGFDATVRDTDFACLTAATGGNGGTGGTVSISACPNVNIASQTWHYLNDGEIITPPPGCACWPRPRRTARVR